MRITNVTINTKIRTYLQSLWNQRRKLHYLQFKKNGTERTYEKDQLKTWTFEIPNLVFYEFIPVKAVYHQNSQN